MCFGWIGRNRDYLSRTVIVYPMGGNETLSVKMSLLVLRRVLTQRRLQVKCPEDSYRYRRVDSRIF